MQWFYLDRGARVGPIDDAELERLIAAQTISGETLVWHEGLSDWQSYASLGAAPATGDVGSCSQCGRPFLPSEMVQFGPRWVCADCKPSFLQRVREGATIAGQKNFGGFWVRAAARLIDGLLMFAVNMLLSMPVIFSSMNLKNLGPQETPPPQFFVVTCLSYLLMFAVQAFYEIYFIVRKGATPGKMVLKLRVERADGSRLTVGRATGRYFATMLNGFTLGIGYIVAAFDVEKRALHDHICDTRVIRS
ncbi:RDD family protein [Amaricoccus sp.]|uniref:RDD family protein n=1 Tax=Amaricoccus sp. TaxID=1872485 RepID=UPI001B626344|nr:RDD family protein [Amaricoccus sp.]MBP7243487.1 RDD family protein [Amaricoccus sp.]